MLPFRLAPLLLCLCVVFYNAGAEGEELREQPTSLSTWLDLRRLESAGGLKTGLPIWLESVRLLREPASAAALEKSTFRLRLRRVGALSEQIQYRVYFRDVAGKSPIVTGWSETGVQRYGPVLLGAGLNVFTSDALVIPTNDLDYIDLEVLGDGENVRGAFVTTLRKSETLDAADFTKLHSVQDAFGNSRPIASEAEDSLLYGRVRATLAKEPVILFRGGEKSYALEFELDARLLLALATVEIHGADPLAPPELYINDQALGPLAFQLPDLADPAYEAVGRSASNAATFQYSGWMQGQKVIPGSSLRVGLNKLVLRTNSSSASIVIRTVELQLKHHWQNLEYRSSP